MRKLFLFLFVSLISLSIHANGTGLDNSKNKVVSESETSMISDSEMNRILPEIIKVYGEISESKKDKLESKNKLIDETPAGKTPTKALIAFLCNFAKDFGIVKEGIMKLVPKTGMYLPNEAIKPILRKALRIGIDEKNGQLNDPVVVYDNFGPSNENENKNKNKDKYKLTFTEIAHKQFLKSNDLTQKN